MKIIFTILAFILTITPLNTKAQSLPISDISSGSALVISPSSPEPNQNVTLTLNDYSINTNGASYTWFVDGTEIESARNKRSTSIIAGPVGSKTNILVRTTLAGGMSYETKATIRPVRIDMLIEANTIVPPFYQGRALPSSGSLTKVTAIPFTSEAISPDSYSYTWKVGGEVVEGGSIKGKNSVTFRSGFDKAVNVAVDISNKGSLVATKSINVPIYKPELLFYVIDPLEGFLLPAYTKSMIFSGEETRLRAEPYYMDANLMASNPYIEWELNGQTITNPNQDQQEIVLRRSGGSGAFSLKFHVRNLNQLLQGVEDSISLRF